MPFVFTQTFCWSHRFDEHHRFNVYFQELVGKHTIIWIVICTLYLRDIGCILTGLYFLTLLSALYFGVAVEEPHQGGTLIN
jgi:hypothetical protein